MRTQQEAIESLSAGDMLIYRCEHCSKMKKRCVLRTNETTTGVKSVYFSQPWKTGEDEVVLSTPDSTHNPMRWCDRKNTLISIDGEIAKWLPREFTIQHGVGVNFVQRYKLIPTLRNLRTHITKADIEKYLTDPKMGSSEKLQRCLGIVRNHESGNLLQTLSLLMQETGITVDPEHIIIVSIMMGTVHAFEAEKFIDELKMRVDASKNGG